MYCDVVKKGSLKNSYIKKAGIIGIGFEYRWNKSIAKCAKYLMYHAVYC